MHTCCWGIDSSADMSGVPYVQVRGVSGGEKKRVTTGEILVGSARVLLMDEISTGMYSQGHKFIPWQYEWG